MATTDTSKHQDLIDQIKCEMGEGGPEQTGETVDTITFRTLAHKERTIEILAADLGYYPDTTEHKNVDGWKMVDITFTQRM